MTFPFHKLWQATCKVAIYHLQVGQKKLYTPGQITERSNCFQVALYVGNAGSYNFASLEIESHFFGGRGWFFIF